MADRWFTPDTAIRTLDRLRPTAEIICRLYRDMERRRPRRIDPDQPVDPDYFKLVGRMNALVDEIQRLGARVTDLRHGMLDFPASRNGRKVSLCWKVGETTIHYWHELNGGFAARRPLCDDDAWDEPL